MIDRDYVPGELAANGPFRRHHPIFSEFTAFSGPVADGESVDYIGARSQPHYLPGAFTPGNPVQHLSVPAVDEEYFEWIDVLMSVRDAGSSYTCVELGAGYGRWGVRAGLAARQAGIPAIRLFFAEAEPMHVLWLREHVALNGIADSEFLLHETAVSDEDGAVDFYVGSPDDFHPDTPRTWYGQCMSKSYEVAGDDDAPVETYAGRPVITFASGWKGVRVRKTAITSLLDAWGTIDLLDLDVQGEEAKIIGSGIAEMNERVKRLHIGTHEPGIEETLRGTLHENGWLNVRDYGCHRVNETPYGVVSFVDGVQSWVNPRHAVTWG